MLYIETICKIIQAIDKQVDAYKDIKSSFLNSMIETMVL